MVHGQSSVLPTVRDEDFDKDRVKRLNTLVTRETISTTSRVGPKYDLKCNHTIKKSEMSESEQ